MVANPLMTRVAQISVNLNHDNDSALSWLYSLSPVVDGSNVHNCFFLRLAPFALSLKPNVSAVMYLCWALMRPIVHHPFCWFCDKMSPLE